MFSSNTTQTSGGYEISRSLRFNIADTAYLQRSPATTTNRRTFTWSAWVKRSELTPYQNTFSANDNVFGLTFNGGDQFQVSFDVGANSVITAQVFRDPSAWYHLVVGVDTTQATAANRVKIYVNGTQVTAFSTSPTYPAQNFDTSVNQASSANRIGAGPTYAGNWFGGYQADVYLIDGQQLTASSFGATDAQTGVWGPTAYAGTYGTNGYYINFSDNSNTTATTLGKDYSGNGNNFTPINLSVTAGAGNDSLVDSPTSYGVDTGVGGTVRGNYCTWNPLYPLSNITNGNLDFSIGSGQGPATSSIYVTSGKWYFEVTPTAITGTSIGEISITDSKQNMAAGYRSTGTKDVDSFSTNAAYGATWTVGDNIGVAFDVDNKQVTFYKNGVSQGAITYTGSSLTTNSMGVLADWRTSATFAGTANFGQRPFAYTAPSGFKALCTQNLPTPTIGATTATQAGKFFNPVIYTGDGVNGRAVTGVGFQPDMVWVKGRSTVSNHVLNDVLRGGSRTLFPNTIEAEYYDPDAFVKSFTSDGFTVGSLGGVNGSGATYVGWSWKANGSGSSNTAGSITSTVSANTTSGFSIVTWTGNGADASIGHGLGVVPSMVIQKFRSAVSNWSVYTSTTGVGKRLKLNSTDAVATDGSFPTTPTSTVFYINGGSNDNGVTMVAYCFAPIAGYSAFGSYTGNGSTDGPFVFTGFRPAYVMVKATISGTADWAIHDVARNTYNVVDNTLLANLSDAEYTSNAPIDMVSNGFKIRTTNPNWNTNTGTYIYICFASNPFKYSLAR